MPGTLSQQLRSLAISLPIAVPESGLPADFLARRPDTGIQLVWPRSALAPGAAPTACILLALLAPSGQGPPEPMSTDQDALPPGSAALPRHPKPWLARAFHRFPPNWR